MTDLEDALVIAIKAYRGSCGYPPTVRELGEIIGRSTSATYGRLRRMRGRRVDWVDGAARTLRVLEEDRDANDD